MKMLHRRDRDELNVLYCDFAPFVNACLIVKFTKAKPREDGCRSTRFLEPSS